jgi:hypothetical protein
MECAAAKRHLELQRSRLSAGHEDSPLLDLLIVKFDECATVTFSRVELFCALRYLRRQSQAVQADMLGLEERQERGGVNGLLFAQYRALDAEAMFLSNVMRILWTFTEVE